MDDCEFFINKRDYPQLKADGSEPYGFLFDRDDKDPAQKLPLLRHKYESHAPILSFYVSDTFAALPMPLSEDWEAATGKVFPPKASDLFCEENFKQFQRPWEEKSAVAFFRGNATGGGIDASTNQRIHLAQLSHEWADSSVLDAKLTGFNPRDKKVANKKMTFLRKGSLAFEVGKQNRVPMYQQAEYKYIIYVEGHCAANRYAFLMRMGSLIIKVESKCVADSMWYFPVLTPLAQDGSNWETADHVPVKEDLSDLGERLRWCREHDAECQRMVENCAGKYQTFVSRDAIFDYLAMLAHEIASRSDHGVRCPEWWQRPLAALPPPQGQTRPDYTCVSFRNADGNITEALCWRCDEEKRAEERMERESEAQGNKAEKKKSAATGRGRAKLKRAREQQGSQSQGPVAKKKFNAAALASAAGAAKKTA